MAPVVSSPIGPTAGGALAGNGQRGWWKEAGLEPRVLVVPGLLGPDRMTGRDQHELVGGRELHHLACGQERPRCLLARDHEMSKPWREPVAGIVLHGAQLGGDAERIGDPLGRALVVGGEGDADMAIVEYGVVGSVSLLDLVQRLRNQEALEPVARHESERGLEEIEPPQRRETHRASAASGAADFLSRAPRSIAGRSG